MLLLMPLKPPLENYALPFEVLTRHKEPLAFCARIVRASTMWSQGGSDSGETGPFEVLTRHKEPLAFCAGIIRTP
jgi:hypothetical protein